jgi:hypothetical protein
MAKATTKLNAQDRVILFCAATGIDHAVVGILARVHGHPWIHRARSGEWAYALTDSERATLAVILKNAGLAAHALTAESPATSPLSFKNLVRVSGTICR